ncbi:unnamed protein product [Notodromas monacha]|uniref:glutaminase n=1 Tax=Notodromas monacha TaxID=399045 RepID=A0A7R9GJ02_9CRUS|nr:unnamed protein product [Notodromas monacha]CAG0924359.1 unnamed protein product [Notodromas monacha]
MNRKELMRDRGLTRFLLRTSTNLSVGDEGKVIINFEEALFAMLEQDGKSFEEQGIRRDDPRLRTIIDTLSQMSLKMSVDSDLGEPVLIENLAIDKTSFIKIVKNNRMIFSKSFRAAFVLPEFRHFSATIKQFYNECKEIPTQNAVVYNRIPQTAKADPGAFGVAVCSIDGQRFSVGDTKTFFLLMSMRVQRSSKSGIRRNSTTELQNRIQNLNLKSNAPIQLSNPMLADLTFADPE